MNKILKERREDVAAAMRGLCDAVGKLSLVRDDLIASMKTAPHGDPEELLALKLNRVVNKLTDSAASVPDELWQIMLGEQEVGGHEVHKRVDTLIKNTMIFNRIADRAVA